MILRRLTIEKTSGLTQDAKCLLQCLLTLFEEKDWATEIKLKSKVLKDDSELKAPAFNKARKLLEEKDLIEYDGGKGVLDVPYRLGKVYEGHPDLVAEPVAPTKPQIYLAARDAGYTSEGDITACVEWYRSKDTFTHGWQQELLEHLKGARG